MSNDRIDQTEELLRTIKWFREELTAAKKDVRECKAI